MKIQNILIENSSLTVRPSGSGQHSRFCRHSHYPADFRNEHACRLDDESQLSAQGCRHNALYRRILFYGEDRGALFCAVRRTVCTGRHVRRIRGEGGPPDRRSGHRRHPQTEPSPRPRESSRRHVGDDRQRRQSHLTSPAGRAGRRRNGKAPPQQAGGGSAGDGRRYLRAFPEPGHHRT